MDDVKTQEALNDVDFVIDNPRATADAPKHVEFDWEGLYQALGESEAELTSGEYEKLGSALITILTWAVKTNSLKVVGRRIVALLWVCDPGLFDGTPSAAQLAKKFRVHKAMLSEDCSAISRRFAFRNRAQRHGSNFKPGGRTKPGR